MAYSPISVTSSAPRLISTSKQKRQTKDFKVRKQEEFLIWKGWNLPQEFFVEGHHAHTGLLEKEAQEGQGSTVSLLIVHAEDQLMSAEAFKTIAAEFIEVYKRMSESASEEMEKIA